MLARGRLQCPFVVPAWTRGALYGAQAGLAVYGVVACQQSEKRRACAVSFVVRGRRAGVGEECGLVIEIRVLKPDDWRLWRELRLAALAEAPAAFSSTLAEWTGAGDTEQRWRARLASAQLSFILSYDGEAAGMVSAIAPGDDGAIELISMWVAPFARGRGVGDAAVRSVLAFAQTERGGSPVVLAVKTQNRPAIGLYERHGFVDIGRSPDDPSERLMRLAQKRGQDVAHGVGSSVDTGS